MLSDEECRVAADALLRAEQDRKPITQLSKTIVVGGRPVRPMDIDIRWVGATLSKNFGSLGGIGVSFR